MNRARDVGTSKRPGEAGQSPRTFFCVVYLVPTREPGGSLARGNSRGTYRQCARYSRADGIARISDTGCIDMLAVRALARNARSSAAPPALPLPSTPFERSLDPLPLPEPVFLPLSPLSVSLSPSSRGESARGRRGPMRARCRRSEYRGSSRGRGPVSQ